MGRGRCIEEGLGSAAKSRLRAEALAEAGQGHALQAKTTYQSGKKARADGRKQWARDFGWSEPVPEHLQLRMQNGDASPAPAPVCRIVDGLLQHSGSQH